MIQRGHLAHVLNHNISTEAVILQWRSYASVMQQVLIQLPSATCCCIMPHNHRNKRYLDVKYIVTPSIILLCVSNICPQNHTRAKNKAWTVKIITTAAVEPIWDKISCILSWPRSSSKLTLLASSHPVCPDTNAEVAFRGEHSSRFL